MAVLGVGTGGNATISGVEASKRVLEMTQLARGLRVVERVWCGLAGGGVGNAGVAGWSGGVGEIVAVAGVGGLAGCFVRRWRRLVLVWVA